MKITISIVLIFFFTCNNFAQEKEKETITLKKNAISLSLLGTSPVYGIIYERAFSNKYTFEIGLGHPIYGISGGLGMKIYPNKIEPQKSKFYTGISLYYVDFLSEKGILNGRYFGGYFPIGFTYFGKSWFSLSLDLGPGNVNLGPTQDYSSFIILYGNLKLGYRF